ncbi:vitellogenin-like isoform X2 [Pristis pectinata]|uniref:vitellogenin-like isoform X2 n=1 Tax=Pristis pectinata TaxID=685728 RepID=UPI00223CF026|nr:vitellogenin-like isoform X2 [Pristis pectinata]
MGWIILALTFGLVGSQKLQYEPVFNIKNTYLYQYSGVVLTGLPENGLAKGGLKITSKVQITSIDHKKHLLKVSSPQIYEYIGIWPDEDFIPSPKLTRKLSPQLSQPVIFEYNRGRVGNIIAHSNIPENILNILRGILNILQISIKRNQNIYDLQENGLEGVCHASYTIQEDKKARHIIVTKSKDLNDCQEKISETKSSAYFKQCKTCQMKGKNLRSVSTYTYILKSTDEGAEISEVVSHESHQFTPSNELDGAASTESRQHLYLLNINDKPMPIQRMPTEKRGSLRYQFSNELMQMPMQLVKPSHNETEIANVLEELVKNSQSKAHPDAPQMFLQLIQLLQSADLAGLQSVWGKNANKQNHRQWILDTIPVAATHEAIQFIQTRIEQEELSQLEAAQALVFVLHSIKPDCHGVDNATVLLSSPYMSKNPFLRKITLLSYGSLIHKYCATVQTCPDKGIQPIHDLVVEAGSKGHEEETILGLKTIGNAGQPTSLKRIQKLLPGFSNSAQSISNRIQLEAVMALRNIGKKEPRKVQNIVMQLFMNKKNRNEMRIRAFIVLLETKPSLALVATVTDLVVRETNLQLTSFIYSYMRSLTGTLVPELQSLAAICNIAMKRLNRKCDTLSYRYSKGIHFGLFRDRFLAGIDTNLYLIKKSEGILPSTAIANIKLYGLGVSTDLLEVGIQAEGIQQALSKSNEGYWRGPRKNSTEHIVEKVSDWKPMPTIKPLLNVYIKALGQELVYVEFNQNDIPEVLKIMSNQAKMDGLIRKFMNHLQRGTSIKWTKSLLASEVRQMVPTSLGLPLELAFYYTIVSAVKGQAKVKTNPALSNLTLPHILNSTIQIESQLAASSVKDVIGIMGINSPMIQAGVEVQLKTSTLIPLNFTVRLNYKKRNVKLETPPWQRESQLFFASTQGFAFSRNIEELAAEKVTPLLPGEESGVRMKALRLAKNSTTDHKEVMDRVLPLSIPGGSVCSAEEPPDDSSWTIQQRCMSADTFGFEVCFKTSVEKTDFTTNSPLYKMVGEKSVEIAIKPVVTPIPVKKLQIELQMQTDDQSFTRGNLLIKTSNWTDTDSSETVQEEGKPVLLTLKKILHAKKQNQRTDRNVFQLQFKPTSINMSQYKERLSSWSSFETSLDTKSGSTSSSSSSSSSSSEQSLFLGDLMVPIFSIFTRAITTDNKEKGYKTETYGANLIDRRLIQVLVDELQEVGSWKACLNAEMPIDHKVTGVLRWGNDCLDYKIAAKAATGYFQHHPAALLKAKWDRIPQSMKEAAQVIADHLANFAFLLGFSERHMKSIPHQLSFIVAATSQRTFDIVVRTYKHVYSRQALLIPAALPFDVSSPSIQPRGLHILTYLSAMFSAASTAECTVTQDMFSPFSENSFKYQMPEGCTHVLAQDCTTELKFIVLITRHAELLTLQLNLPFSEIIVESKMTGNLQLTINGTKMSMASLPFTSSKTLSIERSEKGLKIEAPRLGLESLFFDGKVIKVSTVPWTFGTTCGLCGQGISQGSNEYQQPNRRKTKEVLKFAHSWLLPGENCKDTCKLTKRTVKLNRSVKLHGQDSKCYSTEPVLRCHIGCSPVKTVPVVYGFHCLPTDSNTNPADEQLKSTNFGQKSEDMTSPIDAHVACSCSSECK